MAWDVFHKNKWGLLLIGTAMAVTGCGKEPASREEVQGHVRAYQACAEAAKNKVELSNCAYAVGKM